MSPKVQLIKGNTNRKIFLRVYIMMQQLELAGNFLYDAPDLDNARYFAQSEIDTLHASADFYKHTPFTVKANADTVSIIHTGAGNGKQTIICEFKKIK